MRTYIGKHLKTRSETIRKALTAYNSAARALRKPALKFQDIVKLSFVSEFDLLKDSRDDIRELIWVNPQARMICDAYFRTKHAQEELKRLSVEVRRIVSWMDIQEIRLRSAVKCSVGEALEPGDGSTRQLKTELTDRLDRMRLRHQEIWLWLRKLQRLDGYEGPDLSHSYAKWNSFGAPDSEQPIEEADDYRELVEEEADRLESMDKALYRMGIYN
jgi:hypothetical protein